jgi:hypothetical protein
MKKGSIALTVLRNVLIQTQRILKLIIILMNAFVFGFLATCFALAILAFGRLDIGTRTANQVFLSFPF